MEVDFTLKAVSFSLAKTAIPLKTPSPEFAREVQTAKHGYSAPDLASPNTEGNAEGGTQEMPIHRAHPLVFLL